MSDHDDWVTRFVPMRSARVSTRDDRLLIGFPIVFNSLSQDLGGWKERIAPSAVDRTLRSGTNVDALLDHRRETNAIIGSTDSGLMRQRKEAYGLNVEIAPPDTTFVRDLITNVKAGLVKGMSFAFRVAPDGQIWDQEGEDIVRTVTDMEYSEVSIVVNPAYLATSISARSAEVDRQSFEAHWKGAHWRPSLEMRRRMERARA